jgi:hypothetical protein
VRQVLAFFALWLVGKAGRRRGVGLLVDRKEPPESVR